MFKAANAGLMATQRKGTGNRSAAIGSDNPNTGKGIARDNVKGEP